MSYLKNLMILSIVFISISGCFHTAERDANIHMKELKENFEKDYSKKDLLNHFPEQIKITSSFMMFSAPPGCPPSYECSAQYGKVYLINDIEKTNKLSEDYIFKTAYLDDNNIIINLSELRREKFPVEKCNKAYAEKYPIPYFESYDFGLGKKVTEENIDGEVYFDYNHTIPHDLEVYVIDAEPGDFWKESCNEKRPELLNEWNHGFSRGFALSKDKNIIVYWTMIW